MLEKEIEGWLRKRLRESGCLCYKFISPGNTGVPDRIVITREGRVIFVELKTDKGRLSKLQQAHIQKLRRNRADVRVVRGWEEAMAFAKEVCRYGYEETDSAQV